MGTNCLKQLYQGRFFEHAHAQDLENFVECRFAVQTFFGDRDQSVDTDCHPQLSPNSIGAGAVKGLDPQMLFDPAKEKFYLPTTLIELGDGERREKKVVAEKD